MSFSEGCARRVGGESSIEVGVLVEARPCGENENDLTEGKNREN